MISQNGRWSSLLLLPLLFSMSSILSPRVFAQSCVDPGTCTTTYDHLSSGSCDLNDVLCWSSGLPTPSSVSCVPCIDSATINPELISSLNLGGLKVGGSCSSASTTLTFETSVNVTGTSALESAKLVFGGDGVSENMMWLEGGAICADVGSVIEDAVGGWMWQGPYLGTGSADDRIEVRGEFNFGEQGGARSTIMDIGVDAFDGSLTVFEGPVTLNYVVFNLFAGATLQTYPSGTVLGASAPDTFETSGVTVPILLGTVNHGYGKTWINSGSLAVGFSGLLNLYDGASLIATAAPAFKLDTVGGPCGVIAVHGGGRDHFINALEGNDATCEVRMAGGTILIGDLSMTGGRITGNGVVTGNFQLEAPIFAAAGGILDFGTSSSGPINLNAGSDVVVEVDLAEGGMLRLGELSFSDPGTNFIVRFIGSLDASIGSEPITVVTWEDQTAGGSFSIDTSSLNFGTCANSTVFLNQTGQAVVFTPECGCVVDDDCAEGSCNTQTGECIDGATDDDNDDTAADEGSEESGDNGSGDNPSGIVGQFSSVELVAAGSAVVLFAGAAVVCMGTSRRNRRVTSFDDVSEGGNSLKGEDAAHAKSVVSALRAVEQDVGMSPVPRKGSLPSAGSRSLGSSTHRSQRSNSTRGSSNRPRKGSIPRARKKSVQRDSVEDVGLTPISNFAPDDQSRLSGVTLNSLQAPHYG